MKNLQTKQSQQTTLPTEPIQKLSDEDLALIAGGRGKEDDEPIGEG
ncbi:hypothetical protein [Leptothoe spongobia]|uniref:Bacteriocin n=1 Tax=Leptothoe spongobia TAU-MAC 1115 TaxID=1967444 RepID=A0A947GJC1_9CYAN|nr:hypothetical protein [Leptothoe spongobia]MBT9315823.1 hypothetical protein [Leptothoe spongobia TAU-MAC 1115]